MTEKALFDTIIAERKPVSYVSGENLTPYLNSVLRYSCCAHVIPKKGHLQLDFPNKQAREELLRLNPKNIVLVSPWEHSLIDQGTEKKRAAYEKMYRCSFNNFYKLKQQLIDEIKKELNERF